MALVRKGDAGWARKLRPEHARQHRAEGGSTGFSPPGPTETERAQRTQIYNERMSAMKKLNAEPLPITPDKD